MEKTVGLRIKELRAHYNIGVKEFGTRCDLSHVAVFHFENGRTTRPHKSSLQRIASAYGTTIEWLLFGTGEMLPNGKKDLSDDENNFDAYWKDEAYTELKSKNMLLEKEVDRLWQMVSHFTSGEKPNFQKS